MNGRRETGLGAPGSRTLSIVYYAAFKDAAGVREESWTTTCSTAAQVYEELAARHGFRFDRSALKVAVNDCVVAWDSAIADGDTLVFLAPFAGG